MEVPPLHSLPLGFRFHPTDEELINHYLKGKNNGRIHQVEVIPEIDVCKCEPWDLPEKSLIKTDDPEWFFFAPRDRKYPNGHRLNRATEAGYWKATGKDRTIRSRGSAGLVVVGMKKTLVFYRGRAPKGGRTNWIMHEYRVVENDANGGGLISNEGAYVLYRLFKKPDERNPVPLGSNEQDGMSSSPLTESSPAIEDKSEDIEIMPNHKALLVEELQVLLSRPDEHVHTLDYEEKYDIQPIKAKNDDRNEGCNDNKVSAALEIDAPFDHLANIFSQDAYANLFSGVSTGGGTDHDPCTSVLCRYESGSLLGDSSGCGDPVSNLPIIYGGSNGPQESELLWSNDLWSASEMSVSMLLQQDNEPSLPFGGTNYAYDDLLSCNIGMDRDALETLHGSPTNTDDGFAFSSRDNSPQGFARASNLQPKIAKKKIRLSRKIDFVPQSRLKYDIWNTDDRAVDMIHKEDNQKAPSSVDSCQERRDCIISSFEKVIKGGHLQTDDKEEEQNAQLQVPCGGDVLQLQSSSMSAHTGNDDMCTNEKLSSSSNKAEQFIPDTGLRAPHEMHNFPLETKQAHLLVKSSEATDPDPCKLAKEASQLMGDPCRTPKAGYGSRLVFLVVGAIPVIILAMYSGLSKYF